MTYFARSRPESWTDVLQVLNGFRHKTPVRAVVALSNSGEVLINHGLPAV